MFFRKDKDTERIGKRIRSIGIIGCLGLFSLWLASRLRFSRDQLSDDELDDLIYRIRHDEA